MFVNFETQNNTSITSIINLQHKLSKDSIQNNLPEESKVEKDSKDKEK